MRIKLDRDIPLMERAMYKKRDLMLVFEILCDDPT